MIESKFQFEKRVRSNQENYIKEKKEIEIKFNKQIEQVYRREQNAKSEVD